MERVFVVGTGSQAVLRLVKSGAAQGDRLEILSGLDAGERVVVNPPAGLREGQLLEILP
jgi:multidrug efflux pump subunit AcrA (membrane-fusion protein)